MSVNVYQKKMEMSVLFGVSSVLQPTLECLSQKHDMVLVIGDLIAGVGNALGFPQENKEPDRYIMIYKK